MISSLNIVPVQEKETKRPVMVQKRVTYNSISFPELQEMFNDFQNTGKILNENYADDTWIVLDRTKDVKHRLHFDGIKYKSETKAFIILHLKTTQTENASAIGRFLMKVLAATDGLKKDSFDKNELGVFSQYQKWVFLDFLDFIEIDMKKIRTIIEKIEEYTDSSSNQSRALPNYQSIMIFDTLINRFMEDDLQFYPIYFPIVLWWKLTMLIPMRPIEFFLLKESDFRKKEDGCYIHITRSIKSDVEEKYNHPIPLIDEFKIDEQLFDLFIAYIKTQDISVEGFIFNSKGLDLLNEREFMGRGIFQHLLRHFFKEVIEGKYGYTVTEKESQQFLDTNEIEYINYGDTRHLAFLNLILSGYNPYTIAQLGGHRTLQTQMSYYSGAVSYCTSKAFSLAFGLIKLDTLDALSMATWKQNRLLSVPQELSSVRKIGVGYCSCENFPYECYTADCESGKCQYYIADNKNNLNESIENIKDDIAEKVDVLRAILYKEPNDSVVRSETCNYIQEKVIELARLYKNISILEGE